MSLIQNHGAVRPLNRRISLRPDAASVLPSVAEMVQTLRPEVPLHCIRPQAIAAAAGSFVAAFPGDVLYAVKCNPEPAVLRAVWAGGVRHFDCASISRSRWSAACSPGRKSISCTR